MLNYKDIITSIALPLIFFCNFASAESSNPADIIAQDFNAECESIVMKALERDPPLTLDEIIAEQKASGASDERIKCVSAAYAKIVDNNGVRAADVNVNDEGDIKVNDEDEDDEILINRTPLRSDFYFQTRSAGGSGIGVSQN